MASRHGVTYPPGLTCYPSARSVQVSGTAELFGQKFFPNDPLVNEPEPYRVDDASPRPLSGLIDYFENAFGEQGERHPSGGVIEALGVNTLGEVMEGSWYNLRHYRTRMSPAELARGAGNENPPDPNASWEVLTVKRFGTRTGLLISDGSDSLYFLRFDVPRQPEMMTGAQVVSGKFFWALGYWTTQDYLVNFNRSQLQASEGGKDITSIGKTRPLQEEDIDALLNNVASDGRGGYRAVAHRIAAEARLLGPFQLFGTRSDDPNDIFPHEHRRELRGLRVFSAWLNHVYMSTLATMDGVAARPDTTPHLFHLLIDFIGTLGSGYGQIKSAYEGYEPAFGWMSSLQNLAGMGVYSKPWMRVNYPKHRSVGRFEYELFDPEEWHSVAPLVPFDNMLPDDSFWAARQVMAFTDADIRAIVATGEYSDPAAEEWIVRCLSGRRDKIGQVYFNKVLPLEKFRIEGGELAFDDLAVVHGLIGSRTYSVTWGALDNLTGQIRPINVNRVSGTMMTVPEIVAGADPGRYLSATIAATDSPHEVVAYFRTSENGLNLAGIEHHWEGKVVAPPAEEETEEIVSRYNELTPTQRELFDPYAVAQSAAAGKNETPDEYFGTLRLSERTTFEAVTHALEETSLTAEDGTSLGIALDQVVAIERIAGAYLNRGGDAQFRVYVKLKDTARDTLEKSTEFFRDKDNTVFHAGYPFSYRQTGKLPNIQFSMSEDGLSGDVDVDYRSSKSPQALWNGHLTASNSDIRAGKNYVLHDLRWAGLVDWWLDYFGKVPEYHVQRPDLFVAPPETPTPLPPDRPYGASPALVQDAAQEWLTDWLVRGNIDEAIAFMSAQAKSCLNVDDRERLEQMSLADAKAHLQMSMSSLVDVLGLKANLTEAVDAILPWSEVVPVREHEFDGEFTLVEVPDSVAAAFQCEVRSDEGLRDVLENKEFQYGNYFGTMFRLKDDRNQGGVLSVLWAKEDGAWKIVSWEAVTD